VATARADTKNPLIANVVRITFLPVAWLSVQFGLGIVTIVALSIVGEMSALFASLYLVRRRLHMSIRSLRLTLISSGVVLVSSSLGTLSTGYFELELRYIYITSSAIALMFLILSAPELRSWVCARGEI
jgi:hypothetical protein